MSEPVPLTAIVQPDPSLPSPSPASASTSTLISPDPISHLSKGDLEVGEESPPPTHTSTVLKTPNTSTPIVSNSLSTGAPMPLLDIPPPPNMSFASLNLHAQTLGHSITQREGLSKGVGVGQTVHGDCNEAKMSPRGFVQPHRNHLPRRFKPKTVPLTGQATSASTPALVSTSRSYPGPITQNNSANPQPPHSLDTPPTTISVHPIENTTSAIVPSDSGIIVRELASANLLGSTTISTPPPSSTLNPSTLSSTTPPPPPDTRHEINGSLDVPAIPPLLTARPDRRPLSSPSPLGPNLPRRKVSKRITAPPLPDSVFEAPSSSPASSPSPTPAGAASPAQVLTSSSRPVTPLRSSLRTPGKTPLRSAALAASPFVSTSESESDGEQGRGWQDKGQVQGRSDSPRTSGAVVLGSSPVHTPAQGNPLAPASVPCPMELVEAERGLKRERGKGRRATFALPFPIHGEPRPQALADGKVDDEVVSSLPARLAVASLRDVHGPSPLDKVDRKGTQYVGAGVYVAFLEDGDYGDEIFWDLSASDGVGSQRSAHLDEDEKEIARLRQIVLRVLSDDEDNDVDVVVDVVQETDSVNPTPSLANSTPTLPSPISSSASNSFLLFDRGSNSASFCTENSHTPPALASDVSSSQSELPPTPPSLSSSPVNSNRGERRRKHQQDPEQELVLILPPPVMASSLLSQRISEADMGAGLSVGRSGYADGTSVLSHDQMHQAWKWMRDWMNELDDEEDDVQEKENGKEAGGDDRSEVDVERASRARSRSRARSTSRNEGMVDDHKSRSKSRKRSSHSHVHRSGRKRRRRRREDIQIEILSPPERREDGMGLALGYLFLATPPGKLPIEDLQECLNHGEEIAYTPMHLMWMRLMDVGVRLDDHGDDHYFGGSGKGRKRSHSRKQRSVSRKRNRSQSRPRKADDVDLDADGGLEVDANEQTWGDDDVKPDPQLVPNNDVPIERELYPIPPFRFNTGNLYMSSSSSRSSLCSYSDHCASTDNDVDDPCGYTDEDQPSDSGPVSLNGQQPKGVRRMLQEERIQMGDEDTGEQITLHDIRDEWRGVFSFDGLTKVWESVEMFRLE